MDYQYHPRSAAAAAAVYQGYHHYGGATTDSTHPLKVGRSTVYRPLS